ncbi:MAG: poly-gamma-glutamate synthase PgsB [Bacteroidota bacterium]
MESMYTSYILLFLLITFAAYGVVEYVRHQKCIRSIPIRVHVNGTRGKSSVTRLIGAGLRAGGIPTITKVTGTYPRLILEDGSDVDIYRRGDANIIEQLSIVRLAAKRKAQALVVECMALEPICQRITERQMMRATIGVITNVRLDHIDIMGRTLPAIAAVLGETIPGGRHLFTAENVIPGLLSSLADEKHATMHRTKEDSVAQEEMSGFSYIEHRENVALALAVCQHLGIERQIALEGMYAAVPDAGVLKRSTVDVFGKRITFYNAFAANDPDSTFLVWKRLKDEIGFEGTRIVLLNTRQDRMDRAQQLAELVGKKLNADMDYLMLIGQCPEVVKGMAMRHGLNAKRIISIGWTTPECVFEKVLNVTERASSIVAIGNMGGMGGKVANYFENRSLLAHDRVSDYVGAGSESVVV